MDLLLDKWQQDPHLVEDLLQLDGARVQDMNTVDGLRLFLDDGRIVHFRPSGNAPELRCYVESDSEQDAQAVAATCIQRLASLHVSHQARNVNLQSS